MTALSQVVLTISNELNISYAQAIRLERKLQSAGFCIARQAWVEQAAAVMDEWQAHNNEHRLRKAARPALPREVARATRRDASSGADLHAPDVSRGGSGTHTGHVRARSVGGSR